MILASNPLYCLKPFEEVVELVQPHFSGLEFLAEKAHGWDLREHIKDVLSTTEMTVQVHAPFNDINIASINPRLVDAYLYEIERSLDLAVILDSEVVTVHPGIYSPLGRFWAGARDTAIISLKRISSMAEEYGVICALENMPNLEVTMGVNPDEIMDFIAGSGLAFCLDVGHAHTSGHLDEFLDMVPVNVHLHDNIGTTDEHRTLGEGDIDFEHVMGKLRGYDRNLVIEGRSIESLVESQTYLEKLLSKL